MEAPHPLAMMPAGMGVAVKEEWERQSPVSLHSAHLQHGSAATILAPLGRPGHAQHPLPLSIMSVTMQEPDCLLLGNGSAGGGGTAAARPPPEPCRCEQCGKVLSCAASLRRHQVTHSSERPHACAECGRAFSTAAYLAAHQSTHTQERPHTCPVCGKGFTRSTGLNRHMELHLEGRRLPAPPPAVSSAAAGGAPPPAATVPAAARPPPPAGASPAAQCGVCGKHFTRALSVKAHMRIHTGERPHKCPLCAKAFKNASHLKVHSRTHTKERSHACEHCDKRFAESSSLRRHMLVHTGARPYECDICGKEMRYLSHLKAHRRKHTGETPYQCSLCGQLFRLYQTYRLHVKKHEGQLPTCDTCGKTFSSRTRRDEHAALHTAGVINERGEAPPPPGRPLGLAHQPAPALPPHPGRLPLRLDTLLGRRPDGPQLAEHRAADSLLDRRLDEPMDELSVDGPPPPPLPQ
ncbi:zinc finger protein 771-like [Amphibalanus amphitrite]|uniref:zinc finger protein 771-like n=1 Tax=Amphibalanus amphitrite TaxID=1232801 RepID=UPI001C90EE42|nr:zinc finger protein 771-like [Amphibalanus amphitrite]